VDGSVDNNVVANNFPNHFRKAYSCNNVSHAAELRSEYLTKRRDCQAIPLIEHDVDVELVSRVGLEMW